MNPELSDKRLVPGNPPEVIIFCYCLQKATYILQAYCRDLFRLIVKGFNRRAQYEIIRSKWYNSHTHTHTHTHII